MPSVRDVAGEAKVSMGTVSMVLNDRSQVSPQTRERVEAAIRRLGYRPRGRGRPVTRQVRTDRLRIGLVCPRLSESGAGPSVYSQFVVAARDAVECEGHSPTVLVGGSGYAHDQMARELLTRKHLDGVILTGIAPEDGYLDHVLQEGLPAVAINRRAESAEFSSVGPDNTGGGRQVAEHLYGLGHRRIAYVSPSADVVYARDRLAGLRLGLKRYGLEPAVVEPIRDGAPREAMAEDARRIARRLIEHRVTAIFATFDKLAVALIDALESLGVDVPRQMSVVGFDATSETSASNLQPTSVAFDGPTIGRTAVDMLVEILDPKSPSRFAAQTLETWLVERDTTAPVPGGADGQMMQRRRSAP